MLRYAYIGDEDDGVEVQGRKLRGDLYPAIVGAFRVPENKEEDCAENTAKFPTDPSGDTSFKPHLHLVFENIMFTSWNNDDGDITERPCPRLPG